MVAIDINENILLTVRIKGLRQLHIRLWLTKQVLKLATRILGWQLSFKGWSNNADIIG